jgi:hypothetical protein
MLSLCGTRRTQKKRDNMTDYTEAGNAANGAKMANELLEAREEIQRLKDELDATKRAEIKDLQDTGRDLEELREAREIIAKLKGQLVDAELNARNQYWANKTQAREFKEQLSEQIRELFLNEELTRAGAETLAEEFDIELTREVSIAGTVEFTATHTVGLLDEEEFDIENLEVHRLELEYDGANIEVNSSEIDQAAQID